MDKIEIPLSKLKLLIGIGASILLVILGIVLFSTIADNQTRHNPTLVKIVGLAGILFFGATTIYGFNKLSDKSFGLTIDDEGIIDNTNASSVGLIKWSDITDIRTKQVMSTKFLLIYTKDPSRILENVKGLKRQVMLGNMKMYGTPLAITSNTLKCNFEELQKLLMEWLSKKRADQV